MENEDFEEDIDGCIHSIRVKNFFCHDNLEVIFNRNVNFVVGRNGSGKSAILAALMIGFGSRASVTNRGTKLTSFIKRGTNSATIEIKIKNNSAKAYKHDLYGDYITIIRHINASGGSTYKVKSASGEVISNKFEEVNAIVIAHDIQVDNPISVLSQDDARDFHKADEKKKYLLFRKATNLDQTEMNYTRTLENCNKATERWNKKNIALSELEKEYKKWKQSHEQLQSRDEIEQQKQALQNEYYWSEIADLEKEAKTIQTQYDKEKANMEKLVAKISEMEQKFGSNNGVIQGLKDQLQEKTSEEATLEQQMCQLKSEVREVQSTLRSAQSSSVKQRELLKREKRKVADLEREIQNIDSGGDSARRSTLESLAASARAAAEAACARYETAQHEAAQARNNLAHAQAAHDQATTKAQHQRNKLKQVKQQLRELESRSHSALAVYGGNMAELHARVQAAAKRGEFSAAPRGPVGAYIKVKEKAWVGALEHIIGGSLQAFCVNNAEDSRKLFEIMGQVYGKQPKPSVTCSKFLNKQHDVRRNKVIASGFLSALDSIEVSDPVVANFLIDNVRLESILLVPEHDDAIRLSDTEENVPSNCSKIVTLDGTEYHPAPNYRSYGGADKHGRFLQVGAAERKRQVLAEIEEAESKLQSLEQQAEELSQESRRARDMERSASRALQALLADRHDKTEAAKAAAAALEQHYTPHYTVLEEELATSQQKVQTLQEQVDEFTKKDQELRNRIDGIESQMKKVKTQLGQATTTCRNLREEIYQEEQKLDQDVTDSHRCKQQVQADTAKLDRVKEILDVKRDNIGTKIREALTLCERIDNPRDKMIVTNELKKTQMKLSSIRSDGLSKAQVAERLLEVETKYRQTKSTLDKLKLLIDDIKNTANKHLVFCHKVQTAIATRVQNCFLSILILRGYSGRMNINHTEGKLELICTGRDAESRRAASTDSLSGGERSYSTVAFIMALWECVELPFYFLDEFDVFMDNVNRNIVMKLLIDHALKNTGRQFVFFTPQDTSNITAQPKIKIHLMAAPRA